MKISLVIEGSQTEILAVMERLGCTAAEITVITARLVNGDASPTTFTPNGEDRSLCERISEREREILGFLMEGVSNKEIGHQLGITEFTVKNHIRSLLGKIGVANRTKAALWAQRHMSRIAAQNGQVG